MKTLQFGLRVADREASVGLYTTLGYEVIGDVPKSPTGHLTMLLPNDEFVVLELRRNPERAQGERTHARTTRGLHHLP